MSTTLKSEPVADGTRERLKIAAERLFAERGIRAVTVRDIVAQAGARNSASIHYYFGSKEALIRELVVDGARRIDIRRNEALRQLEAAGGPVDLADVVRLLVQTSIDPEDLTPSGTPSSYLRFIHTLQASDRGLFLDALENRWNSGYLRCLRHIERLLDGVPTAVLKQRLIFMSLFLSATLAARESAMAVRSRSDKLWRTPGALDNLIDSVCGLLCQSPAVVR